MPNDHIAELVDWQIRNGIANGEYHPHTTATAPATPSTPDRTGLGNALSNLARTSARFTAALIDFSRNLSRNTP